MGGCLWRPVCYNIYSPFLGATNTEEWVFLLAYLTGINFTVIPKSKANKKKQN